MNDLFSIEKVVKTEQLLGILTGNGPFAEKSRDILRLFSEAYFPQKCLFVPLVAPKLRSLYFPQICIYEMEIISGLKESDPLVELTKALVPAEAEYSIGLVRELENVDLREQLISENISSFFIIPMRVNGNRIGYMSFFEEEVPRLWSKQDLVDMVNFTEIFSIAFHSDILQNQILAQEAILQKAIESSNDGFWHIDLVENKMHFSKQWKRMLGYGEGELQDSFQTFEELIHPEDVDVVMQVLDPYQKIGVGSYECEYRIRNKGGKYLWVLTRANVNYSENGVPLQFVATNTDITTRIEYKNKIAQSEAKYEKLVGSIHEIIFEIDRNGIITFLNEAWERHLLFKVDKAIGTEVINYIHPEHRALAQEIATRNFKGNPKDHLITELKFIAANGRAVWMEVHSTIAFDSNEEYLGISGTLINIDDRKKMEIARQASENKIARISDNISDIIVEVDEEGKYQFMSNGVRNMLGRNPESFKGESAMKDIHPDDREMVKKNLFDQLMNGAARVVEQYRVLNGDGEYTWIETVVQPLISVTGERTFIAACRDISARRKIQEEIQASLQKEKQLNELKSRFITMTSHEFRTPLSSIKSSIELLEMYAEDLGDRFMKPFERHFKKITSQVGRINNLLNNIDTLGKIEAMEMPFSPVNQNFVEFVSNLLKEQVAEEFPERKVKLTIEGKARDIVFDPSLLENMLLNIIKNALLYSEEDVPELTITFRANDIHIVLKDRGLGIPEDEMNLMFTSFFRAKNIVNLNIPGNGLGLVISKKIVDLHKGTIQLRSEENVGTEVEIILPTLIIE